MNTKHSMPIFDLKMIGEDGLFSGYGSVFGNKDSHGEIVMSGAFAKSLAEHARKGTRPRMFWMHNPEQPIGSWTNMIEDNKGLYVEGRLNMGVQQGREAYALLKAGDIGGLSIGYKVISSQPDEASGSVLLKEVKLFEVSIVSFPANESASVDRVKSADDLRAVFEAGETPKLKLIEEYLRDGGFPDALAVAFVSLGKAAFRQRDSGDETKEAERFLSALLTP